MEYRRPHLLDSGTEQSVQTSLPNNPSLHSGKIRRPCPRHCSFVPKNQSNEDEKNGKSENGQENNQLLSKLKQKGTRIGAIERGCFSKFVLEHISLCLKGSKRTFIATQHNLAGQWVGVVSWMRIMPLKFVTILR